MSSELEVLIGEIEVCGLKIKPWSFSKIGKVAVYVEMLLSVLKTRKIEPEQFLEAISAEGDFEQEILVAVMIYAAPILSVTLDQSLAELDKINLVDGPEIMKAVFKQNETWLKNVFGPRQVPATEKAI